MMDCTSIIGITGGIGSGKSVVSRICRLSGYDVYDCDIQAKTLMDSTVAIRNEICSYIGTKAINSNGTLNRGFIADAIFNDDNLRDKINKTVHTVVFDDLSAWIEHRKKAKILFVESAILKSSGLLEKTDRVWLVEAPDEIRIERVSKRSGMSASEIFARMRVQALEFSDFPMEMTDVIVNDGIQSLLPQIDILMKLF